MKKIIPFIAFVLICKPIRAQSITLPPSGDNQASGKAEKAMEVFRLNQKTKSREKFTTNVGLARGYAALGDKKNAIKHWELALINIPENQKPNIAFYEGELKKNQGLDS